MGRGAAGFFLGQVATWPFGLQRQQDADVKCGLRMRGNQAAALGSAAACLSEPGLLQSGR
jgi:hypothetical protein